mgnify:CR=1 FL=1|tara:strand:- start:477 stop:1493 length:1017 start_codon:yes stop_codon:yes gene_type:complete
MNHSTASRRDFLGQLSALSIAALLPSKLRAEILSVEPEPSQFGPGSTAEQVTAGLDLTGLTFAITGCNSGLGFETMRVLSLRGAHVIGIARTRDKADKACSMVTGEATPENLDLAEWGSIVQCAERIKGLKTPIDGLVANAGIMALPSLKLVNGVERQFAVNHLGHFILMNQLREQVLSAPQGRFVVLSSGLHQRAEQGIEFDNLDGSQHYDPWKAYGVSKLANALCARELARQVEHTDATANCLHPGVIKTNLVRHLPAWQQWGMKYLGVPFLKSIPEGAATSCYVATNPDLVGVRGFYFEDCNVSDNKSLFVEDDAMAKKLWEVSEELTRDYLPGA